ncbi:MAG: hypothetical protein ISR55_01240 [Bacteroidetes bacterium]|nr:hypothetical protein [Bacteroidota bacterium]
MIKYIIFTATILLVLSTASTAQNHQDACKYLIHASRNYCDGHHRASIRNLKKLIKKHPGHTLEDEAFYALARSYQNLNKNNKAQELYLSILELKDEKEADSFGYELFDCSYMQAGCKNILIPDFLVNIQHEACLNLSEMALAKKDFKQALYYILIADKNVRYWYGCGTGDYEEDMRLSLFYSRYYEATQKSDSAIRVLLPYLFEPAAFPNSHYDDLVDRANHLLINKYEKDILKTKLDQVIDHIIQENLGDDHHSSYRYYVLFEGEYIPASPMYLFEHNGNKSEVIEFIKSTSFYQKVSN